MDLADQIQGEIDEGIDYAKAAIDSLNKGEEMSIGREDIVVFTKDDIESIIDTLEDLKKTLNAIDTSQIVEGEDA